ncbi:Cutinase gene palindrome-binding protein [Saitozyma sp. JCM 24511]|nr:Cutinase gene palindrome-binding protein [Saitozyma sp. JCM 24511]
MSLVASSIAGASYALGNTEERDSGTGFEFTRRKRWPQLLLQELAGSALFCVKPTPAQRGSMDSASNRPSGLSWKRAKERRSRGQSQNPGGQAEGSATTADRLLIRRLQIVYASPAVGDMLGQKAPDLEGHDFFELVFGPDHAQLQTLFTSLIHPTPPLPHQSSSNATTDSTPSTSTPGVPPNTPHPLGKSQTTYARMLASADQSRPGSVDGAVKSRGTGGSIGGPVVWEIRAHATGLDGDAGSVNPAAGFGLGGGGTMVPPNRQSEEGDLRGKAVWVMGRIVGESGAETENQQSCVASADRMRVVRLTFRSRLDAFLELKLENERLREELRELQLDLDDDDAARALLLEPTPSRLAQPYAPDLSDSDESDESDSEVSSSASSQVAGNGVSGSATKKKPGRPPKDRDPSGNAVREKKRAKKNSIAMPNKAGEGEGMHVCVTCGRTDSPEWRKGPLGPKTLCNACGLRWAKRNSTAPSRKDRKAAADAKK